MEDGYMENAENITGGNSGIQCLCIAGYIEGHDVLQQGGKVTRYEHIIPSLVAFEESKAAKGLIIVLNTIGGDVEAGLAIAESIASLDKPAVSLVLGGGHSIGVPLAVAAKKSFITPSAAITIHPIRINGMIIGAAQSYDYFNKMQERVNGFISRCSGMDTKKLTSMMMRTGELAGDIGTVLIGKQAVDCGLIDSVGGINSALSALHSMINAISL